MIVIALTTAANAATLVYTGTGDWDLSTTGAWTDGGAAAVWDNTDGAGGYDSASFSGTSITIAPNTDIYVDDITMSTYTGIGGINNANTNLYIAGDVDMSAAGTTGRMQWDQVNITLEADSTWSSQSSWDIRFYKNGDGSMDLNGNIWTLASGKWNLRNFDFDASTAGSGMNIASGAVLDHDTGGITIGTLVYAGEPVAAGDYTSSADWYEGAGTVTVVVPEPATMGLLSLGGLVLLRRRRR
jgi:hypothetical protein